MIKSQIPKFWLIKRKKQQLEIMKELTEIWLDNPDLSLIELFEESVSRSIKDDKFVSLVKNNIAYIRLSSGD